MLKKPKLLPAVIISMVILCSSSVHAQLDLWFKKMDLYDDIPDLHINEDISYPDSPFGPLVREAFSTKDGVHYVYVLDIGDEALSSRIHLIRQAQKAIYIQTFIWANDESGRFVAHELIEAAKRGVKVKVIVDQWRLEAVDELAAYMASAHPNLELKVYSPHANRVTASKLRLLGEMAFKFKQVNQRMHNKIFIVDDRIAITGGRNYENDYFDRGATRNFKDRDVLVVGPVVREMTGSFMQYWAYKMTVNGTDLVDVQSALKKAGLDKYAEDEDFIKGKLMDELIERSSDHNYIKETFVDRIHKVEKLRFIYDSPGKNSSWGLSGSSASTAELVKFLEGAERSIVIQTPYLVLDSAMIKTMKDLRRQKPDLDILISSNSLAATDSIYAYSFAFKQKKLFVKDLKFRIFELKPVPGDIKAMMPRYTKEVERSPQEQEEWSAFSAFESKNRMESREKHMCIHAKSFVLDDSSVWIGSFNFDPRSTHLNTEVALLIYDPVVAKAVKENALRDMAPPNSWTIGRKERVPFISNFSDLMGEVVERVPLVDVWPFRYTSSFSLKENKDVVPFYHDDFYKNYEDAGAFPGVGLSVKEVQIELLKTFGSFATPII